MAPRSAGRPRGRHGWLLAACRHLCVLLVLVSGCAPARSCADGLAWTPPLPASSGIIQGGRALVAAGAGAAARGASSGGDACITAPQDPACATYTYPSSRATADVQDLCKGMPFMPSCSLHAACGQPSGPSAVSSDGAATCAPFQLLATICKVDDMAGMSGCSAFNTLCADGSVVAQCRQYPGLAHLITSDVANRQVKAICTAMTMDGCEKCMPSWSEGRRWSNCSLLDAFGQLCFDMPSMPQCQPLQRMCAVDGSLYPCCGLLPGSPRWGRPCGAPSSGDTGGPVMKMYFFTEYPFYLLFKSWTPSTTGQLVGAWFAIFFMAVLYEALQVLRVRADVACMQADAARRQPAAKALTGAARITAVAGRTAAVAAAAAPDRAGAANSNSNSSSDVGGSCCGNAVVVDLGDKPHASDPGGGGGAAAAALVLPAQRSWRDEYRLRPRQVAVDVLRALLQLVAVGVAYLLMLAAMSYNVAIFFAVIVGVAVGSFLFGRFKKTSAELACLNPEVCHGL